eukprot:scaffold131419_cov63-Phaeocystis_antarctica.AAC.1
MHGIYTLLRQHLLGAAQVDGYTVPRPQARGLLRRHLLSSLGRRRRHHERHDRHAARGALRVGGASPAPLQVLLDERDAPEHGGRADPSVDELLQQAPRLRVAAQLVERLVCLGHLLLRAAVEHADRVDEQLELCGVEHVRHRGRDGCRIGAVGRSCLPAGREPKVQSAAVKCITSLRSTG